MVTIAKYHDYECKVSYLRMVTVWEKFNIQHLTFNITITVYGYKKLYEAGTGSALFPRFVTRGGKCSSDALDLSQSRPSEEAS